MTLLRAASSVFVRGMLLVPLALSCHAVAGDTANIVPFAAYSNYIWLSVRVNGSRPLQFTLDSGASGSVISERIADELGLGVKAQRRKSNLGTGESAPNVSRSANVTLNLSGIDLREKEISVVPMDTLESATGHRIDGILGAGPGPHGMSHVPGASYRPPHLERLQYKGKRVSRTIALSVNVIWDEVGTRMSPMEPIPEIKVWSTPVCARSGLRSQQSAAS